MVPAITQFLEEIGVTTPILTGIFLALLLVCAWDGLRLRRIHRGLQKFLTELDGTGKMLVRRDFELTRLNARLVELDQVKSEFVSVAAHQLRTPLTGIKWTLSSLLKEGEKTFSADQKKILEDAFKATNHLIELINDLLNVARLEEGRFGFNIRQQSLLPLAQKIAERFRLAAKEKGVTLITRLPEELPLFMLDPEKMDIVLDNLLDNAIKYTPSGGNVEFAIAMEGDRAKISVKDSGIGIPDAQRHRMFSKFFRAQNAQLKQTSGTGLGLYVSKNIVEKHGGALSFESQEGKGTTFIIILPASGNVPQSLSRTPLSSARS